MTGTSTFEGRILDKSDRPVVGATVIIESTVGTTRDPDANEVYSRRSEVTTDEDGYLRLEGASVPGVPLIAGEQYRVRSSPASILGNALVFTMPAAGGTLNLADIVPEPPLSDPSWSDALASLTVRVAALENGGGSGGSVAWVDITGKPTFAAVATSGAYADLSGKPTIPSTATDVGADPAGAASTAITNHVAATDPHPQYLTPAEGNAAYDAAGSASGAATAAQGYAIQRANHTGTQSADTVVDGTTNKAYTATEKTKLAGVATGATANATDAQLRDRSTHTGTQASTTITGLGTSATRNIGTTTGTVAAGDDGRLSDARTPTSHAASHNLGGADVLTFPARLLTLSTPTLTGTSTSAATGAPSVVNTTTKTDLFALTIPAASVSTGDILVAEFAVDAFNNSGAAVTYAFEYRIGATVLMATAAISFANSSSSRYRINGGLKVAVANAANDLRVSLTHLATNATGVLVAASSVLHAGQITSESLASNNTLGLAVTLGTASANADARPVMASLNRLR